MAQIFHPSTNTIAKASIVAAALGGLAFVGGTYAFQGSPYVTNVRVIRDQPVQFSHQHHVQGLGIDCRYCHTTAETSSFAGIPPTYTCMSCHSQVWTNAKMLEPVRYSLREDDPLKWSRLHDLPDFVYFNHSIHVNKGVGCASCHGRIDGQPLAWKEEPLTMGWCLECHRNPEQRIRPKDEIFNMSYRADNQAEIGEQLVKQYNIPREGLDNCSTCHR